MKTSPRGLAFLTLALLLGLPLPHASAINVSETSVGDFPNSPAAVTATYTYTLTSGSNIFSGQCAFGTGDADFFKVVVPAGLRISAVQVTGDGASAFTVPTTPAGPGTYTCGINPGQILNDVNWTITFTLKAIPDYDVTTTSTTITVTKNINLADTLTVSQQIVGGVTDISFSASGRTFSVNGGTSNSGGTLVSLSNITAITINGGSGGETINVGGFSGSSFPSLTIVGGAGNDTVNFTGNITFASNNNLTVNLQSGGSPGADTITVSNGAQLVASGNGAITMLCSKNVSLSGGAVLQTVNGGIDVEANQQTPATTGNFNGVNLDGNGTKIQMTGTPLVYITVKGTGGDDPSGFQIGVNLTNGAQIIGSGNSYLSVIGTGGVSTGIVNRGVTVYGAGSAITGGSDFGATVTGTAGANGSGYGIGVSVLYGGKISAAEGGVAITGTGHGSGDANQGVEIGGAATPASTITSSGNVSLTATPGPGNSIGLIMSDSAAIAPAAAVNISTDSVALDNSVNITATYPDEGISFSTINATHIDLGGNNSPGTLGLSATELNDLTAGILSFYSGDIIISAPLMRSSATDLTLIANSGGYHATASGTDLDLHGGRLFLYAPGALEMPITGPAADAGFPQLNVSTGGIYIFASALDFESTATVPLDLTGTTYSGTAGQQFTILKNNSNAPITGTFNGLPEGAYLVWPGDNTLAAQITYAGGASGHDVVLTLVPVANALRVTTTADDDTSIGSLPTVLAFAAAHSGADTITFDPTLGGQTITLAAPTSGSYAITLTDSAGVTIDASNLPSGLTISGAGASGSFGLFQVNAGASLTLRNVTVANGGGSNFNNNGGAISNAGSTTLINCTFTGNQAPNYNGGAVFGGGPTSSLTALQCTFSGNSAGVGGAVAGGLITLEQCTISNNTATNVAGGVTNVDGSGYTLGPLTMSNCIIAGNTATVASPDFNLNNATLTRSGVNLIGSNDGADYYFPAGQPNTNGDYVGTLASPINPQLATLGSYGGPTKTMPPLLGSPAIDHGSNAAIPTDPATGLPFTTDQRGFTRISNSTVDIGAVETSAFQVTIAGDNGAPGTLRSIVSAATDITNTITFAPALAGSQISFIAARGEIPLAKNFAIDASTLPGGITITGGTTTRIFSVSGAQTTVVLNALTLINGNGVSTTASGSGGAIYNNGATLTLNQCTLSNNSTNGSAGAGGAIRQTTGTLTLNRCTVANNTANTSSANVGGVAGGTGTLALNQCTFSGNSTVGQGGAVAIANGGVLNVNQCTISGNQAGVQGGGINTGGAFTLTNSIVARNAAPTGADIEFFAGTLTRSGRNVIGNNDTVATQFPTGAPNGNGDYAGTTASPVNPLLAQLGSYGGPTLTMALLMGTPAHNAAVNSPFTSDQRGFAITDGHPDIGAYEAGDISNYFAWIYENLPASTANNAAAHATTFDYDGDGVTNFNEWLTLTNPGDPSSYLHFTQVTKNGGAVQFTFPTVAGRHYTIQQSADLVTWTPSAFGTIQGGGTPFVFGFLTSAGPKQFFRVLGGP